MNILTKYHPVVRGIRKYFNFLFERGFTFRHVSFKQQGMIFWNVILESPAFLVILYEDRSEIFLTLAPRKAIIPPNNLQPLERISLEAFIYFISKGEKFIGLYEDNYYRNRNNQFQHLAKLLKEYYDQIIVYFADGPFWQYQQELLQAQKEYIDLQIKKYVYERQKRESFPT
jgi:hypothetical protein